MWDLLQRHRTALVLILALGLPLGSIYHHGRERPEPSVLESLLMKLTDPVHRTAHAVSSGTAGFLGEYLNLVDLGRENERVRRENRVLLGEAKRARKYERQNERLRTLLEFKQGKTDLNLIAARVIARDISPHYRVVKLSLDVGQSDAIGVGMPVVSHDGLVGRIVRVLEDSCEVMLIVDARSHVNVMVPGEGVTGVLSGVGDRNAYSARFRFLYKSEPITANDVVVTSGHDRVFPPGLEVGVITSARASQEEHYYVYEVGPRVNFSMLEEVFVVTNAMADLGPVGVTGESP